MSRNQSLGKWGENIAADYLIRKGYEILFRNWRSPYGELDLIANKGEVISFVEVKTRRGIALGWPEESITPTKQEHLINTSQAFFDENEKYVDCQYQIDVIAILVESQEQRSFQIRHYENAVTGL
ncbi:MAG: YraN family protein [Leptolinea sp.]